MKKITISVSQEVHSELLKIQLEKKLKGNKKTSLAEITSEVLHELLVEKKETPTK